MGTSRRPALALRHPGHVESAISYVSPATHDDTDRAGFRYECPRCHWRAPVMRHRLGALRMGVWHEPRCGT